VHTVSQRVECFGRGQRSEIFSRKCWSIVLHDGVQVGAQLAGMFFDLSTSFRRRHPDKAIPANGAGDGEEHKSKGDHQPARLARH
jgi:hypothetical protein